jgi:hypothetical protein
MRLRNQNGSRVSRDARASDGVVVALERVRVKWNQHEQ